MKRSNKPTAYILLKAYTNSEYDSCDFAIVHITEEWKYRMLQRLELLTACKKDRYFSYTAYSAMPEGFYTYAKAETSNFLSGKESWCFIEISKEKIQDLQELDNELCGHHLQVDGLGMASYKAYAAQTNDEFYTDLFNIKSLLETITA